MGQILAYCHLPLGVNGKKPQISPTSYLAQLCYFSCLKMSLIIIHIQNNNITLNAAPQDFSATIAPLFMSLTFWHIATWDGSMCSWCSDKVARICTFPLYCLYKYEVDEVERRTSFHNAFWDLSSQHPWGPKHIFGSQPSTWVTDLDRNRVLQWKNYPLTERFLNLWLNTSCVRVKIFYLSIR